MHPIPTTTLLLLTLLLLLLLPPTSPVVIKMKKQNIYIPLNTNYTFKLDISQTKSQINPINITIDHLLYNTMGTTNQYFDYFKYLSKEDMQCYRYAIGNASYLFPCPFLLNNDTVLRVYQVEDVVDKEDQLIRGLTEIHEHFIVDNTPYPFPNGAYPYSDLYVTSSTNLIVQFNDSYTNIGIRLIFITVTMILIYMVAIGVLVYKTRKIQQEMLQRSPDYNLKRRPSEISREGREMREEDQESDIDNYEQFVANEASLREGEKRERLSKDSREGNDKQFKGRYRSQDHGKNQQVVREMREEESSATGTIVKRINL